MTYREARKRAGMTIEAAADKLNVSRVALWMWETGRGNPTISNLVKMAEVYGVPVSALDVVDASQGRKEAQT